jgi:hypothetical protein
MIFYVFTEIEADSGYRYRKTLGFRTAEARSRYIKNIVLWPDEEWSDLEEWESTEAEWPHVQIIG